MNNAKTNLLSILEEIAAVMGRVQEVDNAVLDMGSYIAKSGEHFCGTAACVLGYWVIDKHPNEHEDWLIAEAGNKLEYLDSLCSKALGKTSLSRSIWMTESLDRKERALKSELFTQEEIDTVIHLCSNKPTAKDAKDYIELCIKKVKCYHE